MSKFCTCIYLNVDILVSLVGLSSLWKLAQNCFAVYFFLFTFVMKTINVHLSWIIFMTALWNRKCLSIGKYAASWNSEDYGWDNVQMSCQFFFRPDTARFGWLPYYHLMFALHLLWYIRFRQPSGWD